MFCVFSVCCCLVVSTSAIDCLERLVSEMTCYVSSGTLNPTHSLTHSLCMQQLRFVSTSLVILLIFTSRTHVTLKSRSDQRSLFSNFTHVRCTYDAHLATVGHRDDDDDDEIAYFTVR